MDGPTLGDLDLWVYDCECFRHDWLFCLKQAYTGERRHFWDDEAEEFLEFMEEHRDSYFVSFNGSHYDMYIAKAIAAGCSPEEVHEVNDFIIAEGRQGWEHPYLEDCYFRMNDVDLMKDTQLGTSLKSIEGHFGMSVEESEVDFRHEERLTAEERAEVLRYCEHDVDATEQLLMARHDYLETKLALGERAGLSPAKALYLTNAKLTAAVLGAKAEERDDERDYEVPGNLLTDWVPPEALEFFARMRDPEVPDEELWCSKLQLDVGGCPVTLGFGGIHGALPTYREEAAEGRRIINIDVTSYYPSLMIQCGYTSRSMPSPEKFRAIYDERLAAKAAGDKATANALKLIVNTTYGATLNQYNDLYDPLMARSVCVSGQLFLLELACHLVAEVEGLTLIQLNTDGIMVSLDEGAYAGFASIYHEWESRTGFGLEEDDVALVWEKDVNNYAIRMTDGHEKVKGGYLVRGTSKAGAFSVNNNATVVAEALRAWLLDGTPVSETIVACDDPAAFQLIAKAGSKYSRAYQLTAGGEVELQKCNRVFATSDESLGRLYKVKRADGAVAKIESLPDHCLVCNGGMPDISEIDKQWYVRLAERRAESFEKPVEKEKEKKVPTTKTAAKAAQPDYKSMNVCQKLALARKMFSDAKPKKSGVNSHLEFEYYELGDIVPLEVSIFAEVGLLEYSTKVMAETVRTTNPETGEVTEVERPAMIRATVINTDDPSQTLEFELEWPTLPPILNRDGKVASNPLQQLGSAQTYVRRYIKHQILDVCDPDETDASLGEEPEKVTAKSAGKTTVKVTQAGKTSITKPVTRRKVTAPAQSKAKPAEEADRKEAAKRIVEADGPATQLQIRSLKNAIKKTKAECDGDPDVAQLVATIGAETDNLKGEISKKACEGYIKSLGELKEKFEAAASEKTEE